MTANILLMRMPSFFCVYSAFTYILSYLNYGKGEGNQGRIKPAKYFQVLSPLSLEVGIKSRRSVGTIYQNIRPLL